MKKFILIVFSILVPLLLIDNILYYDFSTGKVVSIQKIDTPPTVDQKVVTIDWTSSSLTREDRRIRYLVEDNCTVYYFDSLEKLDPGFQAWKVFKVIRKYNLENTKKKFQKLHKKAF